MATDITQTSEARRLDAAVVAAHAVYTEKAAAATVAWKLAGRPREGGYFDPKAKSYADYQNALEDKQEAYLAWMRAASKHGHHILPQAERP